VNTVAALPAGFESEFSRTGTLANLDRVGRRVEELTGDRPIGNLDDFISQEELRALSDRYKRHRRLQHRGPRDTICRVRFVGRTERLRAISGRPRWVRLTYPDRRRIVLPAGWFLQ